MKKQYIEKKLVKKLFPERMDDSNKNDFGRLLVIAGSYPMSGALYLSSKAAMRAGAGLVYGICVDRVKPLISSLMPEGIFYPCGSGDYISDETLDFAVDMSKKNKFDLLLIGPGLGNEKKTNRTVIKIIKELNIPSIIDADAINALSKENDISFLKNIPTIVTPHTGEAKRLAKGSDEKLALEISSMTGGVCVLKDFITCVTDSDSLFVLDKRNSALSKAGSGDVLAGIIAGLWAQSGKKNGFNLKTALDSAICGVYTHSLCGVFAREKYGKYSVLASDLINLIPLAVKDIYERK
jgi:NAD(P)H-hydrate epimerase